MADPRFFNRAGPFTLAHLAQHAQVTDMRTADEHALMTDVAPLDKAGPQHLSFLDNRKYLSQLEITQAGAVLLAPAHVDRAPPEVSLLVSPEPYRAYARCAQLFYPARVPASGIHPRAHVDPTAIIGEDCIIEAGAVIGPAVRIGARSWIGANAVIEAGVALGCDCRIDANVVISHALIGDRVRIFPGACIGQDGFGFAISADGPVRVPQLGRVILEDDVEVGANATIDRGAGPDTVIGQGTMIDNLVQIGHNVQVGRNCILVAQSGIAGSSRLGNFVVVAAQAGVSGHVTLGDGVRISAKSGVAKNIDEAGDYVGLPVQPARAYWKEQYTLRRLAQEAGRRPTRGPKSEDSQ